MSDTSKISISFWLPTQIALLVIYYGNIVPGLPMWLVWLPTLIFGVLFCGLIVILLISLIIAYVLAHKTDKVTNEFYKNFK